MKSKFIGLGRYGPYFGTVMDDGVANWFRDFRGTVDVSVSRRSFGVRYDIDNYNYRNGGFEFGIRVPIEAIEAAGFSFMDVQPGVMPDEYYFDRNYVLMDKKLYAEDAAKLSGPAAGMMALYPERYLVKVEALRAAIGRAFAEKHRRFGQDEAAAQEKKKFEALEAIKRNIEEKAKTFKDGGKPK